MNDCYQPAIAMQARRAAKWKGCTKIIWKFLPCEGKEMMYVQWKRNLVNWLPYWYVSSKIKKFFNQFSFSSLHTRSHKKGTWAKIHLLSLDLQKRNEKSCKLQKIAEKEAWTEWLLTPWLWLLGEFTFEIFSSYWDGWNIFLTTFNKDFKNANFIKMGLCPSMCNLYLARLLSYAEEASWAELRCSRVFSSNRLRKVLFLQLKNWAFKKSAMM